jgi:curved DNA-binding protein CbpA
LKHHPDKGGDADMFRNVNAAYKVLSRQSTRAKYDKQTKKVREVVERRDDSPVSLSETFSTTFPPNLTIS